jgi:hypothetical protein
MEKALALLSPGDPALPALLVSYLTVTTFRTSLHPLAEERLRPLIDAARKRAASRQSWATRPPADADLP